MYKCCLCGKTYDNEKDTVKCVNRCGREKSQLGIFHSKEAPRQEDITTITFDTPELSMDVDYADLSEFYKNEIEKMLYNLEMGGVAIRNVNYLRATTFANWDNKTPEQQLEALNRLKLMSKIYGK